MNTAQPAASYDAVLVIAFGGPERPEDVLPFLENVTRGRNIPKARLLEVAAHYDHFCGKSPLNEQVRELIAALRVEMAGRKLDLQLYWGNRNWHPFLADTLGDMAAAGVTRALGLVLAAYSSYSSCRQYLEDVARAREAVGPKAPVVEKIRVFYNHPGFIAANADRLRAALVQIPALRAGQARIAFTAHSIPVSMANCCDYEAQLREAARLVCAELEFPADRQQLVFQSRSGRPSDPWLGPDILEHLGALHAQGVEDVVVMPIGFLSDHLEVLYDLDVEAARRSEELELNMVRAATVGTHPAFVAMLADLIEERLHPGAERPAAGRFAARPDVCPAECCLPGTPPAPR